MSNLFERLESLGLSQYYDALVGEGFDTWETILDITESDLNVLNFKLGHRRKLQRAILETRSTFPDRVHPLYQAKGGYHDVSYRSDDSNDNKAARKGEGTAAGGTTTSTKRKYRRHPKPDEHAPERPPSAYVIFSNQMREELKGKELTFTEIAKVVGERWQTLSAEARETYEREANAAKEKYYAELAEYKKTPHYAEYQEYLKDFKAKHAPANEGKRSKTETNECHPPSNATDPSDRRRASHAYSDGLTMRHQARAGSTPPAQYAQPGVAPVGAMGSFPSQHAFAPAGTNRMMDQYSPMSTSPRSAFNSEFPEVVTGSSSAAGLRDRPLEPHVAPAPLQTFPSNSSASTTASVTPPSVGLSSISGALRDGPRGRRNFRDSPTLPSLSHEDTTLSSDSARTSLSNTPRGPVLPFIDSGKTPRMLPQPVPSIGPGSIFDAKTTPTPTTVASPDIRASATPLAALLQASEIARNNDLALQQQQQQHPQQYMNLQQAKHSAAPSYLPPPQSRR